LRLLALLHLPETKGSKSQQSSSKHGTQNSTDNATCIAGRASTFTQTLIDIVKSEETTLAITGLDARRTSRARVEGSVI
jgi:hypothetical protein